MSTATLALRSGARRWADDGWAWAQRYRALWPAAGLVVATLFAYNFTVSSLYDYLRLDTPLAYLPLLPFFSIGIALFTAHRYRYAAPPIADRQVDFLIGIPLLLVAVAMITILPALATTYYWTDRPDVLSLAIFVAAGVIILYGVNWLWRIRSAIVFLVLMWPALYVRLMPGLLQHFTDATNNTLGFVVRHLPLGVTDGGGSGLLVVHPASEAPLTISVGSACSGANSVLGFALIGAALLTGTTGRRRNKLLWFAAGLGLVFVLNVARLTSILWLAGIGHSALALGAYHALIGLVLFAVAVVVMLLIRPGFGLRPRSDIAPTAVPVSAVPAMRPRPRWRRIAQYSTLGVVVAFVALADHELMPYAQFLDGTGAPTVRAFADGAPLPHGVGISHVGNYPWAQQYFGSNSSFDRYLLTGTGANVVYADVVRTDDKGSLDAYSLQNCFLFHNYDIRTSRRLDLGNGVFGLLLNYSDSATHARWATVSWAWPIKYHGETYYERIALTSDLTPGSAQAPDFRPADGLQGFILDLLNRTGGGTNDPSVENLYHAADVKLQAVAGELVGVTVKETSS